MSESYQRITNTPIHLIWLAENPESQNFICGRKMENDRSSGAKFQCPIAGLEFNGKYRFFALRNCGHVLSAKALKEVKSSCCLVCHKEFEELDKIVINGNDEEVVVLRERMWKTTKEKKMKKKVKNGNVDDDDDDYDGVSLDGKRLSGRKHGVDDKVVAKAEGNGKVGLKGMSDVDVAVAVAVAAKRFKATDIAPANATKDVYASIFTSSRKSDFKETYSCRSLPLGRN
ncbi:putative replication termination factor 2, Zinc finger, RING/FYVE/PHD-type [Lupinus albus]|uniref:Putative replication termination factor 2, Zinc finger, RING/FYVE/PHD-type n=1 Tax=Lupinus albus TaxID=3870 RepID=A0A6A4PLE0_LUPAL|nr:putative replication termination factor 2, Zinc finger, RING/FYVE/PHD-type [Lupinus albus]